MELISREDAIKCLDGNVLITEQKEAEAVKEYFETVIARLKALPTIEERKEGRWANVSFSIGKCSECGFSGGNCYVMNYCPNCGARMKGE
jgi:rubrerythrin